MKQLVLVPLLIALLTGCQHSSDTMQSASKAVVAPGTVQLTPSVATPDSVAASPPLLALTSNALQLMSQPTGSTREIPFGMP